MDKVSLTAAKRSSDPAHEIRDRGYIPAIIYGPGIDGENIDIEIEYQTFRKTFRKTGESTLIELEIEGKSIPVLVHIFQRHPLTNDFMHIDFYAVNMGQEVQTHIPLVFVGTAPVVKEQNGVIVFNKRQITVTCLPKDLVHDIEVDISGLENFHDHVTIGQLNIPAGITVLEDEIENVVTASPPKKEIEEEPTEEAALLEGEEEEEGAEGKGEEGGEDAGDAKDGGDE